MKPYFKKYSLSIILSLVILFSLTRLVWGWTNPTANPPTGSGIMTSSSDNVGIGTTAPRTRLELDNDGAILAIGTNGSGWVEPNLGAGTRLLWYPRKSAFRAGYVNGTYWDDANIGNYSTAMGEDTTASGLTSTAMGESTTASGLYSTAMGYYTIASGDGSTAIGYGTTASGSNSTAMGYSTTASGVDSTAMGLYTTASGSNSTAIGQYVTAGTAAKTIVLGQGVNDTNRLVNNIASSLMVGFNSTIPTLFVGPSSGAGTTGNVGIASTTPWGLLSVNPNGIAGPAFVIGSSTATKLIVTNGGNMGVGTASVDTNYKITTSGGGIKAENSSATESAGYFDNGSTGPDIQLGTGGIKFSDSTIQTTAAAGGNLWVDRGSNNISNANSGNVGIGTTSPATALNIGNAGILQVNSAGDDKNIQMYHNDAHGWIKTSAGGLMLDPDSGTVYLYDGTNPFTFYMYNGATVKNVLNANGNSYITGGNVGIGTTAPGAKLEIANGIFSNTNTATQGILISGDATSNPGYMGTRYTLNNTSANYAGFVRAVRTTGTTFIGLEIGSETNHGIRFLTNGTADAAEKMRITDTGNVGIGTAAPVSKLSIVNTSAGAETIPLTISNAGDLTAGTTASLAFSTYNEGGAATSKISGVTVNAPGGLYRTDFYNYIPAGLTNHMSLYNGNVGIGTTGPGDKLHVIGDIQVGAANGIKGTYTGTTGRYMLLAQSTNTVLRPMDNGATNGVAIQQYDGTGIAFFQQGGNVGIGTTNPKTTLDVNGAARIMGFVAPTTGAGLELYYSGGANLLSFDRDTSTYKGINYSGLTHSFLINTGASALYVKSDGNVGIGTTAPDVALDVNGYTQLGSDAPKIKIKKLTGTTGTTEGDSVGVSHGLTFSKILSVSVLVEIPAVTEIKIPPEASYYNETQYSVLVIGTGGGGDNKIYIVNHATNSGSILSKPFVITVIYEE